jgi:hypothetical protein
MAYFLVELYLSCADASEPQRAAARARADAQRLTRDGIEVHYLSSIFVRDDEICFHLLEAPSAEAVQQANEKATPGLARVSQVEILE